MVVEGLRGLVVQKRHTHARGEGMPGCACPAPAHLGPLDYAHIRIAKVGLLTTRTLDRGSLEIDLPRVQAGATHHQHHSHSISMTDPHHSQTTHAITPERYT